MFGVMNKQIEQQVARARRVGFFIAEHTITPAIPRVTALAGQVTTWIGEAETEGSDQVQGFGDFRGGSGTRAEMARALERRLRQIGRTARSLPRDLFPGVREQFRVPNSLRYQQTIDTGNAFLAAIGPIKAAFVERAYPADFDEKLSDQIAAFEAATQRKELGNLKRRGGTSGLGVTIATRIQRSTPSRKPPSACTCRRPSNRPRPRLQAGAAAAAAQEAPRQPWPARRLCRQMGTMMAKPRPQQSTRG